MSERVKDVLTGLIVTAVFFGVVLALAGCSSIGIERSHVWDNGESHAPGERNPGGRGRVS